MRSALVMLLVLGGAANAQECGDGFRNDVLVLERWSGSAAEYSGARVSMDLRNNTDRNIRMVRGNVRFLDPFGESIGNLQIEPDVEIEAGATHSESGTYGVARLARVNPSDVSAFACVQGVVYSDGEVEDFR